MATYIHSKSHAFRKMDDVQQPLARRSEGRLKRYTSVTDTRAWASNALEYKRFFCEFMCKDVSTKHGVVGQYIPLEAIWNVLLKNKNNHIFDLENRIQSFVALLQKIHFTKTQILRIQEMCETTFHSINDYFFKHEIVLRTTNLDINEKGIQAMPRTLNIITETTLTPKVTPTKSAFVGTVPKEMRHKLSNTLPKTISDSSNETNPRNVCDVCLQVRLAPVPTADKCVAVKWRLSSRTLLKKPSMTDQSTETIECVLSIATTDQSEGVMSRTRHGKSETDASNQVDSSACINTQTSAEELIRVVKKDQSEGINVSLKSDKSEKDFFIQVESTARNFTQTSGDEFVSAEELTPVEKVNRPVLAKSQSVVIHTKSANIEANLPRLSRKSCVTFESTTSPMKAFTSKDSIDPMDLLNDMKTTESSGLIEVISQSNQISDVEDTSVVQLYRSAKTESIVSTFITTSEQTLRSTEKSFPGNVSQSNQTSHRPTATKKVDVNIQPKIPCRNQRVGRRSITKDHSTDPVTNELSSSKQTQSVKPRKSRKMSKRVVDDEDDGNNEKFHDCISVTLMKDQETQYVSTLETETLDASKIESMNVSRNTELVQKSTYDATSIAQGVIKQLQFIRETLMYNNVRIQEFDTSQLVKILKSHPYDKHLGIESFLFKCTGFDHVEPVLVINELLLLATAFCDTVTNQKLTSFENIETCTDTMSKGYLQEASFRQIASNLHKENLDLITIPSEDTYRQIEYYKMKQVKMEQLMLEKTKLQERAFQLENDIKQYDRIKYEIITDPKIAPHIGPDDILREICEMKRKLILSEHTENELECQKTCVAQLTDRISQMTIGRVSEFQMLRKKANQFEMLQLETDRLRLQITDMKKLRAENANLMNKCEELQCVLLAHRESDLKLARQSEEIEQLQKNKQELQGAIARKEIAIVDQEEEISRLVAHVDRLTTANEELQEKSRQIVAQLRGDLTAKDTYINQMDSNLGAVKDKLKDSITTVCKDSTQHQSKIWELESECRQYKHKNDMMQDTINSLRKQLEMQEELNRTYSMELQKRGTLQETENAEERMNEKLESINRMEVILSKSHKAVRKMVENLTRDYLVNIS